MPRRPKALRGIAPDVALVGGLLLFTALCYVLIPEFKAMFHDVTLAELAQNEELAEDVTVRVEGTVCGVEPYSLGVGDDEDNVLLCITDGEHRIEPMGDRADWGFAPQLARFHWTAWGP